MNEYVSRFINFVNLQNKKVFLKGNHYRLNGNSLPNLVYIRTNVKYEKLLKLAKKANVSLLKEPSDKIDYTRFKIVFH